MPGAAGCRSHIEYLGRQELDLLIVGETNEWETNEYVRDAADMGLAKALIITGHQRSEEAGYLCTNSSKYFIMIKWYSDNVMKGCVRLYKAVFLDFYGTLVHEDSQCHVS